MSTWTITEKSTGELRCTVEGEAWQKAQEKAFNKLAKQVELPGFRKGQAPKNLVRKNIQTGQILLEAAESIANSELQKGVEEHNLWLLASPSMDLESMDENKVEFKFICTVRPEVTLGEYKGLPMQAAEVSVSDEEIEAEIKLLQDRYAENVVKEGAAELNDTVVIDFEGFKDDVAFDGGKGENYPLTLGSGSFIPGFEDQLVGAKAGDHVEVNVTFPEQYQAEELAGQPCVFKVDVKEVKTRVLPELNDDFAKDLNMPNVETLDELKKSIQERKQEEKENSAKVEAENALLDKLVEGATVEIPEIMIEDQTQQLLQQMAARFSQQGISFEQYLQISGQSIDDVKKQYAQDAEKQVKLRLVLDQIATVENIVAGEEDVEKEFENLAAHYGMEVSEVKKYIPASDLKLDVIMRKALEFVKDNATK